MNNPLFITYREESKDGLEYYILQKSFPHYKAKINAIPVKNFIEATPIAGYNLYLIFDGTIAGSFIPSYKDVVDEIRMSMAQMANWFLDERILKDEKRYKKFKII